MSIPAAFTASGNLAGLAVAMQTVGVLISSLRLGMRADLFIETFGLRCGHRHAQAQNHAARAKLCCLQPQLPHSLVGAAALGCVVG